jgi:hypothetical protein
MYSPLFVPPLCIAKRGNHLLYNEIAPFLAKQGRGLGDEYM